MRNLSKSLLVVIGLAIGFVVVVLVGMAGAMTYSYYKSWEIDYRNHQAMVQIIQYNLQQGKLMPLPQPPATPAMVPQTPPPPSDTPIKPTTAPAAAPTPPVKK